MTWSGNSHALFCRGGELRMSAGLATWIGVIDQAVDAHG